ncbi:amino acid ABC transporter permease [Leptolyngbya sp. FACHB-16]|nr:amino acid ABC transporter permease [Leptolyngbya sp. FACHB-8]MBD2156627.1 amino acid ABC transporter permease [Leptolyngbya sp. FACHB-16]
MAIAPLLIITFALAEPTCEVTVQDFFQTIVRALPNLLLGAGVTLVLTAVAIVLGMTLGTFIGIARLSPIPAIRWITRAYVDFFRGTPLLVQIFWIYFGFPALSNSLGIKFTMNQWTAAILALTLNSAAYLAEIIRAGIQSIEIGQREASESLGLGANQTMRYVIFPQAFRRMIPPIGNEFITLLKDTSLVAVIGLEETFRRGQLIVAQTYQAFEVYTAVALIYLLLTSLSSQFFTFLEKRMDPVERARRKAVSPPLRAQAE